MTFICDQIAWPQTSFCSIHTRVLFIDVTAGAWCGWLIWVMFHFSLSASCHSWYLNTFSNNKCAIPITLVFWWTQKLRSEYLGVSCAHFIFHIKIHIFLSPKIISIIYFGLPLDFWSFWKMMFTESSSKQEFFFFLSFTLSSVVHSEWHFHNF